MRLKLPPNHAAHLLTRPWDGVQHPKRPSRRPSPKPSPLTPLPSDGRGAPGWERENRPFRSLSRRFLNNPPSDHGTIIARLYA